MMESCSSLVQLWEEKIEIAKVDANAVALHVLQANIKESSEARRAARKALVRRAERPQLPPGPSVYALSYHKEERRTRAQPPPAITFIHSEKPNEASPSQPVVYLGVGQGAATWDRRTWKTKPKARRTRGSKAPRKAVRKATTQTGELKKA